MVITRTIRDTVVTVAADTAMIQALLECDSIGQVRLRELTKYRAGERLRPPTVTVRENVLTATATLDSLQLYLQLRDRYEVRSSTTAERIVETVEVNVLTWWQTLWVRLGQLMTATITAVTLYRITKPKIRRYGR